MILATRFGAICMSPGGARAQERLTAAPRGATLYVHTRAPTQRGAGKHQQREDWSMHGYCLKCREKREMKDAQAVTLKNGREARQGSCSVCGTKITILGGGKAGGR